LPSGPKRLGKEAYSAIYKAEFQNEGLNLKEADTSQIVMVYFERHIAEGAGSLSVQTSDRVLAVGRSLLRSSAVGLAERGTPPPSTRALACASHSRVFIGLLMLFARRAFVHCSHKMSHWA